MWSFNALWKAVILALLFAIFGTGCVLHGTVDLKASGEVGIDETGVVLKGNVERWEAGIKWSGWLADALAALEKKDVN